MISGKGIWSQATTEDTSMSNPYICQRITSLSIKQLGAVGTGLFATAGVGGFVYYRTIWLPERAVHAKRDRSVPPVRRTPLYIAGTADGTGLLPESRSMPTLVFFLYFAYRMARLFVACIPVLWFGFLTYTLRLCTERVFYDKVLECLLFMGPSYIKFGQWMATRPDFFPPELCTVLERLYDCTEAHSWSHTEKVLRRIYKDGAAKGGNALCYISEIEKKPINSGSIAQIHRAKLRVDVDDVPAGTELAIKITHPYIHEQVAVDLAAMRLFASIAGAVIPGIRYLNLDSGVNEFSSLIRSQLNLLIECDNLQQFAYNFRDFSGVIIPTPLPSLSTEDVLFETFEEGEPLHSVECSTENRDVAELGCNMFLKMLFEDNFVHSDLHPGNILLRHNALGGTKLFYPNGKLKLERELVVFDAGLVTTLSKDERNNFISLFAAVACGDGNLGADLMLDRLPATQKSGSEVDREKFRREMKEIFDMVRPESEGFKLSTIRIGTVLGKIMSTVRENRAPIDGNFASLVLTVLVGEGLGRKLMPHFNLFAESAPYLVSFLEDSELYFLANKLRDTYGMPALLRDSVDLVRPEMTFTYIEVGAKKGYNFLRNVFVTNSKPAEG